MASCIAPISKAIISPLSRLLKKQTMSEQELFEEIFGKSDNSGQEQMSNESKLEGLEKNMQVYDTLRQEFLANVAVLREELALMDKKNGKYRNKFVALFSKKTRYAKTKQELNETELLCEIAAYAREVTGEYYCELLREIWLNTPSGPVESKSTTNSLAFTPVEESSIAWETVSEPTSTADCPSSAREATDDDDEKIEMNETENTNNVSEIQYVDEQDTYMMNVDNNDNNVSTIINADIAYEDVLHKEKTMEIVPALDASMDIMDGEIIGKDKQVCASSTIQATIEPFVAVETQQEASNKDNDLSLISEMDKDRKGEMKLADYRIAEILVQLFYS